MNTQPSEIVAAAYLNPLFSNAVAQCSGYLDDLIVSEIDRLLMWISDEEKYEDSTQEETHNDTCTSDQDLEKRSIRVETPADAWAALVLSLCIRSAVPHRGLRKSLRVEPMNFTMHWLTNGTMLKKVDCFGNILIP